MGPSPQLSHLLRATIWHLPAPERNKKLSCHCQREGKSVSVLSAAQCLGLSQLKVNTNFKKANETALQHLKSDSTQLVKLDFIKGLVLEVRTHSCGSFALLFHCRCPPKVTAMEIKAFYKWETWLLVNWLEKKEGCLRMKSASVCPLGLWHFRVERQREGHASECVQWEWHRTLGTWIWGSYVLMSSVCWDSGWHNCSIRYLIQWEKGWISMTS